MGRLDDRRTKRCQAVVGLLLAFVAEECRRAGAPAGAADVSLRPADEEASLRESCGLQHTLPGGHAVPEARVSVMQTLYEDELVEAVIGLCTAGRLAGITPIQVSRFHADRERCYTIVDPDRRAEGFARVHLDWFGNWGLRDRLTTAIGRFPRLTRACVAVVFRLARGRQDEGADLYRDAQGNRRAVVASRADRVVTEPMLVGLLHHELAHPADLVSPEFGGLDRAGRGSTTGERTPSQERLIRERYRLLWALRIDGELTRRGLPGLGTRDSRRSELDRIFGFLSESRRAEVFDGLWDGLVATHHALLRLAADPRELEGSREPVPGAPCPLCGFAAFRWADAGGSGRGGNANPSTVFARNRPTARSRRRDRPYPEGATPAEERVRFVVVRARSPSAGAI